MFKYIIALLIIINRHMHKTSTYNTTELYALLSLNSSYNKIILYQNKFEDQKFKPNYRETKYRLLATTDYYKQVFDEEKLTVVNSLNNIIPQIQDVEGPLLLILVTHGLQYNGNYYIEDVAGKDFFLQIKYKNVSTQLDIILETCYGKAVVNSINYLPQGTRVMSVYGETDAWFPRESLGHYSYMLSKLSDFSFSKYLFSFLHSTKDTMQPDENYNILFMVSNGQYSGSIFSIIKQFVTQKNQEPTSYLNFTYNNAIQNSFNKIWLLGKNQDTTSEICKIIDQWLFHSKSDCIKKVDHIIKDMNLICEGHIFTGNDWKDLRKKVDDPTQNWANKWLLNNLDCSSSFPNTNNYPSNDIGFNRVLLSAIEYNDALGDIQQCNTFIDEL